MTKLSINLKKLRAIAMFASQEDTRYYLNGVAVYHTTAGRLKLVATNGHLLGLLDLDGQDGYITSLGKDKPTPENSTVLIISTKAIERAARDTSVKWSGEKFLDIEAALPDGKSTAVVVGKKSANDDSTLLSDTVQSRVIVDGQFPDFQRVIPQAADGDFKRSMDSFNTEYLMKFQKAMKLMNCGPGITVIPNKTNTGPSLVITTCREFLGVIMPMRLDAPRDEAELSTVLGRVLK